MMKRFQQQFDWTDYFSISGNKVNIKEGKEIEFKESFHSPKHHNKILLRWIASFANANGGLIIYGINDSQEIIGLKDRKFIEFDNKNLTQELNNFFSPEINFEMFSLNILNHILGFLYIYENNYKPVIATKTGDKNVVEGEIYFRYSAQSKKILYPELNNILKREYNNLNNSWIDLIKKVATIGVENVGILNVNSGEISGKKGTLFLDKSLLPNINFIKEGSFDEIEGSPALKILGEVVPADSNKIITMTEVERKSISIEDVYNRFLDRDVKSSNAFEYLRDIISENTKFLPIYYFIHSTGKTKKEVNDLLLREKGANKAKIIERITTEFAILDTFKKGSITYDNRQSKQRFNFLNEIRNSNEINHLGWSKSMYNYFLEAITHIELEEYDYQYLNPILKEIFNSQFEKGGSVRDNFRRVICHLDLITYGRNLN